MMGHLLCGLILGWLAAAASFWMGHSLDTMLGIYVLGANLGVLLGVLWSLGLHGGTDWIARWPALKDQPR
jgi:hypothetical protein